MGETFTECHCPRLLSEKCSIYPPDGYKVPIKWSTSKMSVDTGMCHMTGLKSKNLPKEGEKFHLPGGGIMFSDSVGLYVNLMQDLITIRMPLILDVGALRLLFFLGFTQLGLHQ